MYVALEGVTAASSDDCENGTDGFLDSRLKGQQGTVMTLSAVPRSGDAAGGSRADDAALAESQ